MALDWSGIWKRVFKLIDTQGTPSYYSGTRFISAVQEIDPYFSNYTEYIQERVKLNQSTTRRDWYKDIFFRLGEPDRFKLVNIILNEVQSNNPNLSAEIRTLMSGGISAPSATIPAYAWNGDRLNEYLDGMDAAISIFLRQREWHERRLGESDISAGMDTYIQCLHTTHHARFHL
jgi:hypothetical protein